MLAREIAENIVADPRTSWALEQGLTIIPPAVMEEVQEGYFGSTSPVSEADKNLVITATSLGLNAAIAKIALDARGSSIREIFERTSIAGLLVSLETELPDLSPTHYDLKPLEYIGDIQDTFTGRWIWELHLLESDYLFIENHTPADKEIEAFIEVVGLVVHALKEDMYFQEMTGSVDEAINKANLAHAREFLMDLVNARWHITPLSKVPEQSSITSRSNEAGVVESQEQDPEDVLKQIFATAKRCSVDLPPSVSVESVLKSISGKESVRGNFRPEELLRNALIVARKRASDPQEVREQLMRLHALTNKFTTHSK